MNEAAKIWIEYAKTDLAGAESLIKDSTFGNLVLFHCQQSIEKILKAVFEMKQLKVPKIHSVFTLYNLLPLKIKKRIKYWDG